MECRERGLDPMDTNLVVADESRTDKTICLAVTPSLKSYGISGRGRLFEVKQRVKEANAGRRHDAPGRRLEGKSHFFSELQADPKLEIDFIIAPPRMAYYMEYSTRIYEVYLKYIAPEDIVVYSIDEVFMDVTDYLNTYNLSAHDLAMKIILDVIETTGITATAGIGTNLYLCKIAMDVVAKHIPADKNGVRIAELDEMTYRQTMWSHQPLTDFWRVGRGYAKKLEEHGMFTMGDVARCSERDEDLLYRLFGKNAELLIDHAWGWEPTTIEAIKAYRPSTNSLGSGQVLHCPYEADKAKLVLREMADMLTLDLVDKGLVTDQIVVTVGYDIENLTDPERRAKYHGAVVKDHYGRQIAGDLRCILNGENIVILCQLIHNVLSEGASFFVGHAEQFSAIGDAGVVMTGPLLVPEIGSAIVFRVNLSVNEVEDYIVNPNCVTAGFLAGVLAGDFPAAQKVESGCFADVSDTVKLILRNDLGVLLSDGVIVFHFRFHADNHLVFIRLLGRCHLHSIL